jgi:hypothetical protein
MTDALRDAQVILLGTLLLVACAAKLLRVMRTRSVDGLGPTVLFPLWLRQPAAMVMCAAEFILGAGLLITGTLARPRAAAAATVLRLATGLLFLTATASLIELRARRPEAGCGCFGDLSIEPVRLRTIARCALLTVAAAASVRAPAISLAPATMERELRVLAPASAAGLAVLAAEFLLIAALSPETGELLLQLRYRAPCEVRRIRPERTLRALRSSRTWRRHAPLLISDEPVDVWRDQCWRYAVFPGRAGQRSADVVFAVYMRCWRPPVLAAVTDAATGEVLDPPAQAQVPAQAGEADRDPMAAGT